MINYEHFLYAYSATMYQISVSNSQFYFWRFRSNFFLEAGILTAGGGENTDPVHFLSSHLSGTPAPLHAVACSKRIHNI